MPPIHSPSWSNRSFPPAVQAIGACSRDGRSRFSSRQIDAIIESARPELGDDELDQALAEGAGGERSEIYRMMWSQFRPIFDEADRSGSNGSTLPVS